MFDMAGGGFGMRQIKGGGDLVMVADPTTFKVLRSGDRVGVV